MKKNNRCGLTAFGKKCLYLLPLFYCGMGQAQESVAVPEGMARIIVEAEAMPGFLGVQMLLDSKAESCGDSYQTYSLPSNVTNPRDWRNRASFYDTTFDYRIPGEASVKDSIPVGLVNGTSDTLDLPAGRYDYILVYFNPSGYMYYVSGDEKVGDDFLFEEGKTYKYSFNSNATLTYWPPFSISLVKEAMLPRWSHDLGTDDSVSIKVINTGLEPLTAFEAGYSVNGADSVREMVSCHVASGDTLEYVFKQNPDFSAVGLLDIAFFVQMDADTRTEDNAFATTLYHPAVRNIPFHEDFGHNDSLLHWQTEDLRVGNASNRGTARIDMSDGALESKGLLVMRSNTDSSAFYLVSDPFQIEKGFQHVSFYYSGGSVSNPEQIGLFYGSASDVATMQRGGSVSSIFTPSKPMPWLPKEYGWEKAVFNIEFEEDGVYYFAIGLTTQTGSSHEIYVDEFAIDTGRYNLIPDFELLSLILPNSTCGMQADSIGATVRNAGGVPMPGFEMAYSVNGGAWKSFFTTDTMQVGEMRTFYFDTMVDFSSVGVYEVVVAGSCNGQDVFDNDTLRATVYHYDPIAEFPYEADFSDPQGDARKEWYADSASKWTYDAEGGWSASRNAGMIHSRCLDLQAGVYRINLRYKAGEYEVTSGYRVYDDFSIGLGVSGASDTSVLIDMRSRLTNNQLVDFDTVFELTEAGTYVFWVDPYNAGHFALASFGLEEAFYNDIRLETFSSATLASVMPAAQMDATHTFAASFSNRGWNEVSNPMLAMYVEDTVEVAFSDSMPFVLSQIPAGTELEIHAVAVMDSVDEYPEDNHAVIRVSVTDSVMATENAVAGKEVKGTFSAMPTGNTYALVKADTLTSFTYGFMGRSGSADSLAFLLYEARKQEGRFYVGDTVLDFRFRMPGDTGVFTQPIPSLPMQPGLYFASMVTPLGGNPGFMADSMADGRFYSLQRDVLSVVNGQGNMMLRLNFGPERSPYVVADLAVFRISGPEDSTLMTDNEEISAQIVNYSNVAVQGVPVLWSVDDKEFRDTIDLEASTAVTLNQTVDFSALGSHQVEVSVLWPNDSDTSNNILARTFVCVQKTDNENIEESRLLVYPNPASTLLQLKSNFKMENVSLFDSYGRCLFDRRIGSDVLEINVEEFPAGAYFLRVVGTGETIVKKIIVNGKDN